MSLVARHLEANGIPTVVIGTARDIVEHCSVPRFLFVDFPLGSPCGSPFDVEMQREIVTSGLSLFTTATEGGTTEQHPFTWPQGESWKETIFTPEQPFLSEEAVKNWEARKQRYRDQQSGAS